MLLQAHGRLSTRELAERLETSQRTAHRDMEALSAAGIPVLALRGSQGGWELAPGWRTKVPGLDEAELRALLMAQSSALGHPGLAAASDRAFGKLVAAMPRRMQTQAASIRARLHIDPVGWHPTAEDPGLLPICQDAIARDCKLTFLYERGDGDRGVRTVEPYGIVAKQGTWYLVARAPAGMRTYRVNRMQNAVVLAVTFKRPANFDLAAHWKTATAALQQKREQFPATLALAPDAVIELRRWCKVTPAPEVRYTPAIPAQWAIAHIAFANEEEARFVIMGFGARAQVLSPVSLRDQLQRELHEAMARPALSLLSQP
jgi:predicted DNA-binding transcriptional regulator YafY